MWLLKVVKPCGCWRILASAPIAYVDLQQTICAAQCALREGEYILPIPATKELSQACRAQLHAMAAHLAAEGSVKAAPPVAGGGCGGKCQTPSVSFPLPSPSSTSAVTCHPKPNFWQKLQAIARRVLRRAKG